MKTTRLTAPTLLRTLILALLTFCALAALSDYYPRQGAVVWADEEAGCTKGGTPETLSDGTPACNCTVDKGKCTCIVKCEPILN